MKRILVIFPFLVLNTVVSSQTHLTASGQTEPFTLRAGSKTGATEVKQSTPRNSLAFAGTKVTQVGPKRILLSCPDGFMPRTVTLFDLTGRHIVRAFIPGVPSVPIDIPSLSGGTYLLTISGEGRRESIRVFLGTTSDRRGM